MKKQIDKDLIIHYKKYFPSRLKSINKKYRVILGIGGNIGDVFKRFEQLFLKIRKDTKLSIIQTSPILQNPPFGYLEQDDFYNAIIVLKTDLSPILLLNLMQKYENIFGRKRSFKDAPRTLDIDILYIYKNKKSLMIDTKRLIVPHLGVKYRDSVTIPMEYIDTF